jgi:hypothetical protein
MKNRTMIKIAATAMLALATGLTTQQLRAQDPEQQQQQPGEVDQATQEAIQAAADAAYQAGLEAQQQQQGDMQSPMMMPPTTQMAPDEEETPAPNNGGRTPTTRPIRQNRLQVSRRTTTTTRPTSTTPQPRPRSIYTDYMLLLHRSIFIKGKQTDVVDLNARPTTEPTGGSENVRAERNLVFNGLTESDDATALIEDINSHRVSKLHVGDSIASGKITRIAFDDLDYTSVNGMVTSVQFGENLEGNAPAPTSAPSSYATSSGGGSGGNSSGTSSNNTGGAPATVNQSVLERMRQRRLSGQ